MGPAPEEQAMRKTLLRWLAVLVVVLPVVVDGSMASSKLVHMKNGRVVRVPSLEDGPVGWLIATMPGGNTLGIPLHLVASIEDDPIQGEESGDLPNMVTSGRYLPTPAGNRQPPRNVNAVPPDTTAEEGEAEAETPALSQPAPAQPVSPAQMGTPSPTRADPTRSRTQRFRNNQPGSN
jgi:hypothetical protein